MIISFNPQLFQTDDEAIQKNVAELLVLLLGTNHFLEITDIDTFFFDKDKFIFRENNIAKNFLSKKHIVDLEKWISSIISKSSYITNLKKKHLSSVKIGNEVEEIIPSNAVRIIKERSKVIVENGINDWNFIKGICAKYESHKLRGGIYQLINTAIKEEILEADNAGGIGEIIKRVNLWIEDRYKDIYKLKLIAIFDSDRISSLVFDTHKEIIAFFKNKERNAIQDTDYVYQTDDIILWHILYKRKLENYLPLSVMLVKLKTISPAQKTALESKTPNELDFIDYDNSIVGLRKNQIKDQFPKMFLENFSYRDLERRCEHHLFWSEETGSEISEFEQILLKIAKII